MNKKMTVVTKKTKWEGSPADVVIDKKLAKKGIKEGSIEDNKADAKAKKRLGYK